MPERCGVERVLERRLQWNMVCLRCVLSEFPWFLWLLLLIASVVAV